jgi:hypothetical protein
MFPTAIYYGSMSVNGRDGNTIEEMTQIIDHELVNDRPVFAVVNVGRWGRRPDSRHVILITGREQKDDGTVEYSYMDPGSRHPRLREGRLLYDPEVGTCRREGNRGLNA